MDPFFSQMHAQMNAQMRRMQEDMMSGVPMGDSFMERPQYSPRDGGRGVQIEEVEDGHPGATGRPQPVVEEPDDPQESAAARHQRQYDAHRRARQQQIWEEQERQQQVQQMSPFGFFPSGGLFGQMMNFPSFSSVAGPSGATTSYSYSSFSSTGGRGGVTYQETKTARKGPGGIMEESHTVRDGRTGKEKMKLTRGLGERQRTLEQQRCNGEDIHRTEHLQGFRTAEEAQQFDSEWQARAQGGLLPGYGGNSRHGSRQHHRIQPPSVGFENPAARQNALDGQSHPHHIRHDPRFRQV